VEINFDEKLSRIKSIIKRQELLDQFVNARLTHEENKAADVPWQVWRNCHHMRTSGDRAYSGQS